MNIQAEVKTILHMGYSSSCNVMCRPAFMETVLPFADMTAFIEVFAWVLRSYNTMLGFKKTTNSNFVWILFYFLSISVYNKNNLSSEFVYNNLSFSISLEFQLKFLLKIILV